VSKTFIGFTNFSIALSHLRIFQIALSNLEYRQVEMIDVVFSFFFCSGLREHNLLLEVFRIQGFKLIKRVNNPELIGGLMEITLQLALIFYQVAFDEGASAVLLPTTRHDKTLLDSNIAVPSVSMTPIFHLFKYSELNSFSSRLDKLILLAHRVTL
jgi:hypothetical protein